MKNKKRAYMFLFLPLVLISILLINGIQGKTGGDSSKEISYSSLLAMVENNEIKKLDIDVRTGYLTYTLRNKDKKESYVLADPTYFHDSVEKSILNINKKAKTDKEKIELNYVKSRDWGAFLLSIPSLLVTLIFLGMFLPILKINKGKGNNDDESEGLSSLMFGKRKFLPAKSEVRFDSVAGADEEKLELQEVVDFLKTPDLYTKVGARIPKGVLMVGPPGTGKTLLARAVAGEAGVPFFSISGSDFVEMYVGVGAQRVRSLFKTAKKSAPSIIFIDEIDAIGRKRGGEGNSNTESENTLNQLLVELDGFSKAENVIVIAATNRPEMLDSALMRPGRFDRQICVNLPDVKGREEILRVHSKNKTLCSDVNLSDVAASCAGFSGADIENLLNEAALLSVRDGNQAITQKNIDDAVLKVVMGTEKKSSIISDVDKKITAFHEAGHAVVTYYLPTQESVQQISIIPRGMSAGFTMFKTTDENKHITGDFVLDSICSLLGGRAAEGLLKQQCAGASNDIERATELARKYVTEWGLSPKFGPIKLIKDNLAEETKAEIDTEINGIILTQYKRALMIVRENAEKIKQVSLKLMTEEKISGFEFEKMMK